MRNVPKPPTYDQIVRRIVKDASHNGVSGGMDDLMARLRHAAMDSFKPWPRVTNDVTRYFNTLYQREVRKKRGQGDVQRFTRDNMSYRSKEILNSKIESSLSLIRLNREISVAEAEKRLVGWMSSVPPGGTDVDLPDTKKIVKSLKQLPFEERRVIIDQGHKLTSSLNEVLSIEAGAIAAIWHSHVHQVGYNYRPDHAIRDGKVYLIRGSWADIKGLVIPVHGYADEMTQPAEEPFCRCYYQYRFNLKDLPSNMLTQKAKDILAGKRKLDD